MTKIAFDSPLYFCIPSAFRAVCVLSIGVLIRNGHSVERSHLIRTPSVVVGSADHKFRTAHLGLPQGLCPWLGAGQSLHGTTPPANSTELRSLTAKTSNGAIIEGESGTLARPCLRE